MFETNIKAKCNILKQANPNLLSCVFETKYAQNEIALSDILASLNKDELEALKNNVDVHIRVRDIEEYKRENGIE